MNRTGIEYLDYTWNPIAMRCTPVSEACDHCWHLAMCKRMAANPNLPPDVRRAHAGEHLPVLIQSRLEEPLKKRKPARIGVQFMGDLFHRDIPFDYILQVWAAMVCSQHCTFVVLTKRPERMSIFLNEWLPSAWELALFGQYPSALSHIWLGTTIEKPEYGYRADDLRACPAAVRFLSLEPLLASMSDYPGIYDDMDWVIVGGETGPDARRMYPDWVRDVRDHCRTLALPFFFKQWGKHVPVFQEGSDHLLDGREWREFPNADR